MQSNFRRDYNQRSSNSIQNSGRVGRTTRFEYVNRAGEPVSPTTGKPYARSTNSNSSEGSKRKRPLPIKKSGAMFGGLEPIPTDVTRDPPPRACFNCWQLGHSRRKCTRPAIARMCNNCGRRGEDLHTCPRCSRAHQRYLERLQAKERGEKVERPLPASSEDEDNGADEFLRNFVFPDQDLRHLEMFQDRLREEERERDRELFNEQESYASYQERESSSSCRESDVKYLMPERGREQVHEVSYPPECSIANDSHSDRRQSEPSSRIYVRRNMVAPFTSNSVSSDPVQEILLLAKSIAHLSPETQDLIMRQVMAERKEQAHQRALQGHLEDTWP